MPAIVPHSFLFRFSFPIGRADDIPKSGKRLLNLGPEFALPDLGELHDKPPFGDVRLAWNDDGLGISVEVRGKRNRPNVHKHLVEATDGLQVWIDTRNTQSIHRASRFCHHFCFAPLGEGAGGDKPFGVQLPIQQARENAPLAPKGSLTASSELYKDGYLLEAFLPREQLHGFDPVADRENGQPTRLGFFYRIRDIELGSQILSADSTFPYDRDPSLWSTLELVVD